MKHYYLFGLKNNEGNKFCAINREDNRIYYIDRSLESTIEGIKKLHFGKLRNDLGRYIHPHEQKEELKKRVKLDMNYSIKEFESRGIKYETYSLTKEQISDAQIMIKELPKGYLPELILNTYPKSEINISDI